jgi:hypothetical protein
MKLRTSLAIALGWVVVFTAIAQTASGQANQVQPGVTRLPQAAATTGLPQPAATTALPSPAATTALPDAAAAAALPDPAATTSVPDPAATTATPEPAATAALPDPAVTPAVPDPVATPPVATQGFFAPSATLAATVLPGTVLAPEMGTMDPSTEDSVSAAADRRLLDAVVAALSADPALRGTSLNVTVNDGLVSITGTAATPEQVARVHDVATRVAGAGRVSASVTPSG